MSENKAAQASTMVFSEMALYVMAVAEKYGQEEALQLMYDTFDKHGAQVGTMLGQQFEGKQEVSAPEIWGALAPVWESVGFEFEVQESTPKQVTAKFTTCPVYAGCNAVGMSDELFCQNLGMPLCNAIVKTMNPTANFADIRHRESAEDYCLEQLKVE